MAEVAHCILDSATPIILLGEVQSFQEPVALDRMSYEFDLPGSYRDFDGKIHSVTMERIEESWENFGRGRIHVERALQLQVSLALGKCMRIFMIWWSGAVMAI